MSLHQQPIASGRICGWLSCTKRELPYTTSYLLYFLLLYFILLFHPHPTRTWAARMSLLVKQCIAHGLVYVWLARTVIRNAT
ncbi:hypothetical protein EUX98_g2603 [Antrodiella citrinella]|uniref:Uncharacterized protein n=1 Tax=Antrodiella citrinella TaxID=2447956 RepID=A0A4S4MYK2_9APHY|nr:hypothetical protein EUX98_g2603 [Antrodiella citrinella]